jgi:hypothetical protein
VGSVRSLLVRPFSDDLACVRAELPHGVHKAALTIYDMIMRRIGPELLIRDLSQYSAGIFPLFQHANTQCVLRPDVFAALAVGCASHVLNRGLLACLRAG